MRKMYGEETYYVSSDIMTWIDPTQRVYTLRRERKQSAMKTCIPYRVCYSLGLHLYRTAKGNTGEE